MREDHSRRLVRRVPTQPFATSKRLRPVMKAPSFGSDFQYTASDSLRWNGRGCPAIHVSTAPASYQSNSGPTDPSEPPMNPSRDIENWALTLLAPYMTTILLINQTVVNVGTSRRAGRRARRGDEYGVELWPAAVVSGARDLHEACIAEQSAHLQRSGCEDCVRRRFPAR